MFSQHVIVVPVVRRLVHLFARIVDKAVHATLHHLDPRSNGVVVVGKPAGHLVAIRLAEDREVGQFVASQTLLFNYADVEPTVLDLHAPAPITFLNSSSVISIFLPLGSAMKYLPPEKFHETCSHVTGSSASRTRRAMSYLYSSFARHFAFDSGIVLVRRRFTPRSATLRIFEAGVSADR